MKLYIQYGEFDNLNEIKLKNISEDMMLLENEETAVLIHETNGSSVFNEPKSYEVIDASGVIGIGDFAVFNNVPVSEDGRELFEERFKKRAGLVESEEGFCSIRVLRPLLSDTYVILTIWEEEKSFTNWQTSQAYGHAHAKRGTASGIDKKPGMFPRPSFVTSFNRVI